MSGPYEWRINDIEHKANEATRRLYKLDAIRSHVDRLECTMRDFRAEVTWLRDSLEVANWQIQQLESQITEIVDLAEDKGHGDE